MKRLTITLVLVIALLFSLRLGQAAFFAKTMHSEAHRKAHEPGESSITPQDSGKPTRTKSKPRPLVPVATIEHTDRLLRQTVLTKFANEPDTTVAEFVVEINKAIQATGVAPDELRIHVNKADHAATLRVRDSLEMRNITVIDALNNHFGSSKIRYKVRSGGRVDLGDLSKEIPAESGEPDAFLESVPAR